MSCSGCPCHAYLVFWGLSTCDLACVCPSLEDMTGHNLRGESYWDSSVLWGVQASLWNGFLRGRGGVEAWLAAGLHRANSKEDAAGVSWGGHLLSPGLLPCWRQLLAVLHSAWPPAVCSILLTEWAQEGRPGAEDGPPSWTAPLQTEDCKLFSDIQGWHKGQWHPSGKAEQEAWWSAVCTGGDEGPREKVERELTTEAHLTGASRRVRSQAPPRHGLGGDVVLGEHQQRTVPGRTCCLNPESQPREEQRSPPEGFGPGQVGRPGQTALTQLSVPPEHKQQQHGSSAVSESKVLCWKCCTCNEVKRHCRPEYLPPCQGPALSEVSSTAHLGGLLGVLPAQSVNAHEEHLNVPVGLKERKPMSVGLLLPELTTDDQPFTPGLQVHKEGGCPSRTGQGSGKGSQPELAGSS